MSRDGIIGSLFDHFHYFIIKSKYFISEAEKLQDLVLYTRHYGI